MAVAQDLPSLETRQQYAQAENSVVYDAYNSKLATLTNNQGRILLESEEIAPVIKEAVVAIEDRRFYEHDGVDWQGIARAVWQDVASGSAEQGASTITQQFVKNALAAQDSRTVFQKLRESALAYHLERQWSKDKILTEYLNEIYFGEGATGIEAAAKTYFGYNHPGCGESDEADPCASVLLPWEAALLAGVISSPSAYSPRAFPENATARRNLVLGYMRDQGYITPEDYAEWTEIPIPGAEGRSRRRPRTPWRPTSPPGCASSSSTATAPARRSAAACRSARRSTSSSRTASRRSSSRRWPGSRRRPPSSCSTTRPPACSRWSAAPTTRPRRSTWRPTATASPAPRSSRSPW